MGKFENLTGFEKKTYKALRKLEKEGLIWKSIKK